MESRHLTSTVGTVAAGRAVGTLGVFAMWGILARPWTQLQLGLFLALWTTTQVLAAIFSAGLPTAVLYFLPRCSGSGRWRLVLRIAGTLTITGSALALGVWAAAPALVRWLQPAGLYDVTDLGRYTSAFAPYAFSVVAGAFVEPALVAAGRPAWQAGLASLTGGGLIAVALAASAQGWGVNTTLAVLSVVGMIRLIVGGWLVRFALREDDGRYGMREVGLGEVIRYAVPLAGTDVAGSASRYVDRLVILYFFTAATFSQYQLGAVEVPLGLLLSAVNTVLVPEVSRLYAAGQMRAIAFLWRRTVGRLMWIVLPLWAFLLAFSGPVLVLYVGQRYVDARWVFRIFLMALPLRCAVYNPLLVGMGRPRWALWGSLVDLVVNAGLSLALVHWLLAHRGSWAFLGPALGTVTATYVQVALLVGVIARHLHWRTRDLIPWAQLAKAGVLSVAAAGAARAISRSCGSPAWALACGGAMFAVTVAGPLVATERGREQLRQVAGRAQGGEDG